MNVGYKKRFLRDLEKLPESVKQRVQEIAFVELPGVDDVQQISGLKKLKGFNVYYRLRYSDYRLGISIVEDKIVFHRVLHRKDIYRYFP
ncbi:MAG: type II toxin-antitoxin system RelE family toxin [Desulfohalobiaceae bacterium]